MDGIIVLGPKDLERGLGGQDGPDAVGAQARLTAAGALHESVLPGNGGDARVALLIEHVALLIAEQSQKFRPLDEIIQRVQVRKRHLAQVPPPGSTPLQ